jgi:putative DNA primase/helicase
VGLRFVYSSESEAGMKLSEGLIKELTGGDKMQARFLRQEFFTFTPKCKLWIATNHRPEIKGTDDGIWTRVKLVPFTVQIPESEQISRDVLLATFWDEAPGILAWMVRGCMEWQKTRLNAPPEVTDATQEYREESDSLGDFLDTCCEVAPNARVEMQKLYEAYSTFTATNGAHPWSMNAFGRAMTERGYPKFRSNGSPMQRKGLKLKFNL